MTDVSKQKIVDEFFQIAEQLAEAGRWNSELQEIMDDLGTGCDPQDCLDNLKKCSED